MITRTRARTPGAVVIPLHGGARSSPWPDTVRDNPVTTRCTKGGCKPAVTTRMSGADLSFVTTGKAPLESQPSSRTGENPPYGMIGGIEETSASCEARSAPRSYPTTLGRLPAATRDGTDIITPSGRALIGASCSSCFFLLARLLRARLHEKIPRTAARRARAGGLRRNASNPERLVHLFRLRTRVRVASHVLLIQAKGRGSAARAQ